MSSSAIQELLGLTRHRVVGLVHDQLLGFSSTRESYLALLQHSQSQVELEARENSLAVTAFQNPEFGQSVAEQLPREFGVLFWAKLGESLTLDTSCEFPGFGSFHRTGRGHNLTIGFDPETRELKYPSEAPPPLREYFFEALAAEKNIDVLCRTVLEQILGNMPGWESRELPTLSSLYPSSLRALLKRGLPPVVHSMLGGDMLGGLPSLTGSVVGGGAISAIAFGSALLTYHAWPLAFSIELSVLPEIVVPGIGRFYRRQQITGITREKRTFNVIAFEADKSLYDIVRTNMPPPADDIAA